MKRTPFHLFLLEATKKSKRNTTDPKPLIGQTGSNEKAKKKKELGFEKLGWGRIGTSSLSRPHCLSFPLCVRTRAVDIYGCLPCTQKDTEAKRKKEQRDRQEKKDRKKRDGRVWDIMGYYCYKIVIVIAFSLSLLDKMTCSWHSGDYWMAHFGLGECKVEGGEEMKESHFVFLALSTTFVQSLWFCPRVPVLNC